MEFGREKLKQIRHLMLLAALFVLGIIYSQHVFWGVGFLVRIITPFLAGGAIAFVLNIPMKAFEEKLLGRWRGKGAGSVKRPLCLVLSMVSVLLVLSVVVGTVVPQVASTASEIGKKVPVFMDNVAEALALYRGDFLQKRASEADRQAGSGGDQLGFPFGQCH